MAAGRQRAKLEVVWIKPWSSRWRRRTAVYLSVCQSSTPPCTPSIKTGYRAKTRPRPASCCTLGTEPKVRSTHSRHTCSGEEAAFKTRWSRMRTTLIGSESHDHLIAQAGTMKDRWWTTLSVRRRNPPIWPQGGDV